MGCDLSGPVFTYANILLESLSDGKNDVCLLHRPESSWIRAKLTTRLRGEEKVRGKTRQREERRQKTSEDEDIRNGKPRKENLG